MNRRATHLQRGRVYACTYDETSPYMSTRITKLRVGLRQVGSVWIMATQSDDGSFGCANSFEQSAFVAVETDKFYNNDELRAFGFKS